jgi:hypothetical protein
VTLRHFNAVVFIILIGDLNLPKVLSLSRSRRVSVIFNPDLPQYKQILYGNITPLTTSARSWAIGSLEDRQYIVETLDRGEVLPAASLNLYP